MSNFFNFLCCLGKRDKRSKALAFLEDEGNKIEDGHFMTEDPPLYQDLLNSHKDSSINYFGNHPDFFSKGVSAEEEKVPSQSTLSTQNLKKSVKKKRESRAWTVEEDNLLKKYYKLCGGKWKEIEKYIPFRSMTQCCQRWRRIKPFKTRRPWEAFEDEIVQKMVSEIGPNWQLIAKKMDGRTGKQVRDRYINILDPSINREQWQEEEDRIIYEYYSKIGPFWSEISKHLIGRPENMVKNRFYSHIKKKLGLNVEDPSERNTDQQSMFDDYFHNNESVMNGDAMEYLSNPSHMMDQDQVLGKSMMMDIETEMGGFKINEEDPEEESNPFNEANAFCNDFWREDNYCRNEQMPETFNLARESESESEMRNYCINNNQDNAMDLDKLLTTPSNLS